jgi:hypothetical protein
MTTRRSWWCRAIGGIITTTIITTTTITASIAAIIDVAGHMEVSLNRTFGSCFFGGADRDKKAELSVATVGAEMLQPGGPESVRRSYSFRVFSLAAR